MFIIKAFLSLLYPAYCVGCGRFGSHVCRTCLQQLEPLIIQPHLSFIHPDISWHALYVYQRPLDALIKTMKYGEVAIISEIIAQLMFQAFPPDWTPRICTAVPMHPTKLRQRGFNQAELIGRQLAKLLKISYQPLLKKTVQTCPQASLSQVNRLTHYQPNTFQSTQAISDLDVLLVDDVITTGATLYACSQALLATGARHVFCLGLAHSLQ